MSSLAELKSELIGLEETRRRLRGQIAQAGKQVKVGLWVIGGGVTLIPLYLVGVIFVVGGILYAFINNERKNRFQVTLAEIETRIASLEELMP